MKKSKFNFKLPMSIYDILVELSTTNSKYASTFETVQNDSVEKLTTKALKYDDDKIGMDLLPVKAKRAIAEVFDFGAKKYARHNWRNGFNYSRLIAAAERHLDAFNDGEDNDPESGKSHLAHAGCCIMMLLEHTINRLGTDDRYINENK